MLKLPTFICLDYRLFLFVAISILVYIIVNLLVAYTNN